MVGESERKPERRAGALLVVITMRKEMMMMMKEGKDPVTATETVVHRGEIVPDVMSAPETTSVRPVCVQFVDCSKTNQQMNNY